MRFPNEESASPPAVTQVDCLEVKMPTREGAADHQKAVLNA
jgi:hypothetical protein